MEYYDKADPIDLAKNVGNLDLENLDDIVKIQISTSVNLIYYIFKRKLN